MEIYVTVIGVNITIPVKTIKNKNEECAKPTQKDYPAPKVYIPPVKTEVLHPQTN